MPSSASVFVPQSQKVRSYVPRAAATIAIRPDTAQLAGIDRKARGNLNIADGFARGLKASRLDLMMSPKLAEDGLHRSVKEGHNQIARELDWDMQIPQLVRDCRQLLSALRPSHQHVARNDVNRDECTILAMLQDITMAQCLPEL